MNFSRPFLRLRPGFRGLQGGALLTFRFTDDGTKLELVHKTVISGIPHAQGWPGGLAARWGGGYGSGRGFGPSRAALPAPCAPSRAACCAAWTTFCGLSPPSCNHSPRACHSLGGGRPRRVNFFVVSVLFFWKTVSSGANGTPTFCMGTLSDFWQLFETLARPLGVFHV